jgi:hypothetical protein
LPHLLLPPTGKERLYYEEKKRKNHRIGDRTAEKHEETERKQKKVESSPQLCSWSSWAGRKLKP